jgi:uncharacterized protein YuzE
MKLHYYPETDSLYIELRDEPASETREIAPNMNADIGSDGVIVGLDIEHASASFDLSTLETQGLPLSRLKAA